MKTWDAIMNRLQDIHGEVQWLKKTHTVMTDEMDKQIEAYKVEDKILSWVLDEKPNPIFD